MCASIEVKQHPGVTMLDAGHLVHAQENQTHLPGNLGILCYKNHGFTVSVRGSTICLQFVDISSE